MRNQKLNTPLLNKDKKFILIQWAVEACISLLKYVWGANDLYIQKEIEQKLLRSYCNYY